MRGSSHGYERDGRSLSGGMSREAQSRVYDVLRERDVDRLRTTIRRDVLALLNASAVRIYEPDGLGQMRLLPDAEDVPHLAEEMEARLLPLALQADRSRLSTHQRLHPSLRSLAARCRAEGITVLLLLLRAHQTTLSAFGVHWIGTEWPEYEQRGAFYPYWDAAGLALAAARERDRVEADLAALRRDALTGLPNSHALEDEMTHHVLRGVYSCNRHRCLSELAEPQPPG